MLKILRACREEIDSLLDSFRADFADALIPDIGKSVHELPLRERSGVYRIFHFLKLQSSIYLLHAMQKKSQTTPPRTIKLVRRRL